MVQESLVAILIIHYDNLSISGQKASNVQFGMAADNSQRISQRPIKLTNEEVYSSFQALLMFS